MDDHTKEFSCIPNPVPVSNVHELDGHPTEHISAVTENKTSASTQDPREPNLEETDLSVILSSVVPGNSPRVEAPSFNETDPFKTSNILDSDSEQSSDNLISNQGRDDRKLPDRQNDLEDTTPSQIEKMDNSVFSSETISSENISSENKSKRGRKPKGKKLRNILNVSNSGNYVI